LTVNHFELPDGASLAFTDTGEGRPILLLHGVCMSRKFFDRNVGPLARDHRVIAVDFRSHGDSPRVEGGHTVAQFARDVRALLEHLALTDVTAVGWSMGSFVLWDYLNQFGQDRLASVVIVSQGPSDLAQPDWPYGLADISQLRGFLADTQRDFRGFFSEFVPLMFKAELDLEQLSNFLDLICEVGPNAGALILVDQTLQDYRLQIPQFKTPHLLVWGEDEKVGQLGAGEWLAEKLPESEYVVFEASGHCPMWEEADRFNDVIADWVARH
jgi:non-heme chloroperoxidase